MQPDQDRRAVLAEMAAAGLPVRTDVPDLSMSEVIRITESAAVRARRQADALVSLPFTNLETRRLSEAGELRRLSGAYEATVIQAGMGNARDRNVYTREALQDAVDRGMFEGLQAYADHPTEREAAERPERSVRDLVGTFSNARVVETDGRAEVRAVFTPLQGSAYGWVTDLIESSLAAGGGIVGISINGSGMTKPTKDRDGRIAHQVVRLASLESADLVTKPGAGGRFLRKAS